MATVDKYFKVKNGLHAPSAVISHYLHTPGVTFSTASPSQAGVGILNWDEGEGGLTFGARGGNVNISIGKENVALCYNGSGSAFTDGDVVRIIGAQGQRPSMALAVNTYEATSSKTFGVVTEPINSGEEGFVTTFGIVNNVDTSNFAEGAALWLSSSAGKLTTDVTQSPQHLVFVGYCLKSAPSSGRIFVNPQNGYELEELHNVAITSVADNEILQWNESASLWMNSNLITAITELDGSGSGLDADLLDGQHGTYYAKSDSPNITGTASFNALTASSVYLYPSGNKNTWKEGTLYYSSEEKTIILQGAGSDFEIPVGQREWVRCRNSTASAMPKGVPVYITGVHIPGDPVHGHHPTIALADSSDILKKDVLGLTGESIAAGAHGYVVVRGYIENIDTSNLNNAQRMHLGFSSPGTLVSLPPEYPNYPMDLGWCLTSDSASGTLYVNIFDHTVERFRITEDANIDGNLTVGGNLTILGDQSTISLTNLAVDDSFIYLNSGDTIGDSGTSFSGSGLDDATFIGHFTGSVSVTYKVRIDGVGTGTGGADQFVWSIDDFNTTSSLIDITASAYPIFGNVSIAFVSPYGHTASNLWSGTANPVNVDVGVVANRNTGDSGVGYTHLGMFYDVSDNRFKFFDEYGPEPEGDINIGHESFSLGIVVANEFVGDFTGNLTGNVNGNLNGNATTVTNGVYTTGAYSDPSWITSLSWSKITSTPTSLSGYGITDAQPLDSDLTAIASLSASGFLRRTVSNTWELVDAETVITESPAFDNLQAAIHMGVF